MRRSREICTVRGGMTRRAFARQAGLSLAGAAFAHADGRAREDQGPALALARSADRAAALRTAIELLGPIDFGGHDLYLKANFNSPDPFPATTHPDTLSLVTGLLRERNCGNLTLIERSGMGDTREIWERLGVVPLARQLDLRLLPLEELPAEDWRKVKLEGMTWAAGVEVPRFLDREAYLIQICNLKTHRFGGVFSASLKNSVGLVAKYGLLNAGYNYMKELHSSQQQGSLIAELNLIYNPKLIVMDAMQVFVNGGPETGELASPETCFAGADRVSMDAAGIALLRLNLTLPGQFLAQRTVFEQEQLQRALEIGLGAEHPQAIRFLTSDLHSNRLASQIEAILSEVPKAK